MAALSVQGLACGYGNRVVLENISFELRAGETLCLLGPNGVGKTTLFKTMLGLLPALGGTMSIAGEDTRNWGRKRFARHIAYIPQDHVPAFPFTALEVVLQGRTPQLGTLASIGRHDEQLARAVLASLGIARLAERDYSQLSGGERQMVLIARALAQEPEFLVMDEPTAALDFGNQARVLSRIRSLAQGLNADSSPLGVIMTTHDPNQAFLLDGQVACLGRGGTFTLGETRALLTPELLGQLYDVEVGFGQVSGQSGLSLPVCMPLL